MLDDLLSNQAGWGVAILAAYLIGAIPFGIVFAWAFGLGDLRNIGSGNIGATNVLRTGHKLAAALTLICDSGKGAAMVFMGALHSPALGLAMGGAAFVGHLYPIYLKFQGGKGVATYLGTLLAAQFWIGVAACGIWLVIAALFRISSLAAIVAASILPLIAFVLGHPAVALAGMGMGLLILWKHRGNIARILNGSEPRIGKS